MNQTHIFEDIEFEWDSEKAKLVFKEHAVTFEECATVLAQEDTVTKEDWRNYDEQRFISTGYSSQLRLLTVIWTERGDKIRLITGFKATKDQIKGFNRG